MKDRPLPAAVLADRAEWLSYRRTGIGGSDVPVILGLSRFSTAYELWCDKTGKLGAPKADLDADSPAGWGTHLETGILEVYRQKTRHEVANDGPFAVFRHASTPYLIDTPDALAFVESRDAWAVVNVKTSTTFSRWTAGEVPETVITQLHHEMAVCGLDYAEVPYFVSTAEPLAIFPIERDAGLAELIEEACDAFWSSVVRDDPPAMDWQHPSAVDLIKKLYPRANGRAVRLADDACAIADEFDRQRAAETAAREAKEAAAATLRQLLGENAYGYLPDGRVASCLERTRREHFVKASTFRVFDVSDRPPKGAPAPEGDS